MLSQTHLKNKYHQWALLHWKWITKICTFYLNKKKRKITIMTNNKKIDDNFTTKSNVVSERQKAVIETIRMRLI